MRKESYRTYIIMALTFLFSYFLFVLPAFADETIVFTTTTDGDILLLGGGRTGLAQRFVPSADAVSAIVTAYGYHVGSGSGDVLLSIQGDAAGQPDGSTIASTTIDHQDFTDTDCGSPNPPIAFPEMTAALLNGVTYWLVFTAPDAVFPTDGYSLCTEAGDEDFLGTQGSWGDDVRKDMKGQIELFAASGGEEGATSTAATSTEMTIHNPNQDLFNGIMLLLMSYLGVVWLFRRR